MDSRNLMTKEVVEWVKALAANGLFSVDASGRGDLAPGIKDFVRAVHEVLAGGAAELKTRVPGVSSVRSDLDRKLDQAVASIGCGDSLPDEYTP